jgi:hypothetical protein
MKTAHGGAALCSEAFAILGSRHKAGNDDQ